MAKPKPLPPVELLREYFSYDPDTGVVSQIKRRSNRQTLGPITRTTNHGYYVVTFQYRGLLAHRIAWKLHTGEEPPELIDHVNRDRTDNRWKNLRVSTAADNCANSTLRHRGRYMKGVFKRRESGGWTAMSNSRFIGTFPTELEAHLAFVAWHKQTYGQHSRYA